MKIIKVSHYKRINFVNTVPSQAINETLAFIIIISAALTIYIYEIWRSYLDMH